MATILITGANRGLGLELARQYLLAGWRVLATCRRPEQAIALRALANEHATLTVYPLDVGDFAQIDALARQLSGATIDVLLSNAGVYSDRHRQGFGALDYAMWEYSLRINTLAPIKLAEALLPQVARSEKKLIVAMTSLMGSIADNTSGGSLLYRSSKAALNAAMKTLALDLQAQQIAALLLHPGWVRTEMGGSNAPLTAEQSVHGMVEVIKHFRLTDTGKFLNYAGKELPW